jgi:NADPH-dependent 2,4-dienoyl-CoA reductase/sulfur reductase-like enzyme
VIPSTQALKEHVQKERDQSIVADEFLCAHEHLYVGGDIARFPYHRTNNSLVRIEHYGMAQFHGKIAALNMMGKQVVNDSIPFFWTSQYGKSVRYCGHALKYDNIIIDGELDKLEFVAYFCSEGAVLAVASLGRDPVVSTCAELMNTDEMLTEKQLLAEIKKSGRVTLKGRITKK